MDSCLTVNIVPLEYPFVVLLASSVVIISGHDQYCQSQIHVQYVVVHVFLQLQVSRSILHVYRAQ